MTGTSAQWRGLETFESDSQTILETEIWRQSKMAKRHDKLILTLTMLSLALMVLPWLGAASGNSGDQGQTELFRLLKDNYMRADCVYELKVEDVEAINRFRSDSGNVGYVQYEVTGLAITTFKSCSNADSHVHYRFIEEWSPQAPLIAKPGSVLLVFLKHSAQDGSLWVLAEGSQFPITQEMKEFLKRCCGIGH
jgi:hypothetical protein